MKKGIAFLDYLFVLRLTLFYPVWIFFLAGYWGGKRFANGSSGLSSEIDALWVVVGLTLLMGGVYIFNQICDIETDRINQKLFLIADGYLSIHEAYIEAFFLSAIGLAIGLWVDLRIGLGFLALLFILGWLYNYPPARWKDRPIMGLVSNGMMGFLLYTLGWHSSGSEGIIPYRIVAYILAFGAVYLNTTLPDVDGDRKSGKITFGVRFGIGVTAGWAMVMEAAAVVTAFVFRDWLLFFPGLLVVPFYISAMVRKKISDVVRATQYSIISLTAAICIVFPVYLIPVIGVYVISRWYYRKRFQFDYPSLRYSEQR